MCAIEIGQRRIGVEMQGPEESDEAIGNGEERLCFGSLRIRYGSEEHRRRLERLRARRSSTSGSIAGGCERAGFRAAASPSAAHDGEDSPPSAAAAVAELLPSAAAAAGDDDA